MMFTNEKQINPIYVVGWKDAPVDFLQELQILLRTFTDNPEVVCEREMISQGVIFPLEENIDEVITWKELEHYGLLFAINYTLRERGIYVLGKHGVHLSREASEFEPQEVDAWTQVLRRFGYKVEGLTA